MFMKREQEQGYMHMNGDVGKIPPGHHIYPTTHDHYNMSVVGGTPVGEYGLLMNGIESTESHGEHHTAPRGSAMNYNADSSVYHSETGIPLDKLKQLLSTQLEYYFSRENLANDTYLLSQMDNDQYVPIWTVANFNQVKRLTKDIKLITEVLRESPNVQVDEEGLKVRPNHKRCIVILREIPDSTPLEDVKGIFSSENCPKLVSCEFAHNNSWYVTFENDEDAQRAYGYLREEVREFQGKPIMARIKAKPMNRIPISSVPSSVVNMKNGYRTPPGTTTSVGAPAPVASAVYEPAPSYQPPPPPPPPTSHQRVLYTNSTALPPAINYANQFQIYAFQQQPFYHPSMLPHWGHAGQAYFDIGSVFPVNGLPQPSSFTKAQNNRYTTRPNNRNKMRQNSDYRNSISESNATSNPVGSRSTTKAYSSIGNTNSSGSGGTVAVTGSTAKSQSEISRNGTASGSTPSSSPSLTSETSHLPNKNPPDSTLPVNNTSTVSQQRVAVTSNSQDCSQQYAQTKDSALPPRRKKKDEDTSHTSNHIIKTADPGRSNACHKFDLEDKAFPPLPAHGVETSTTTSTPVPVHSTVTSDQSDNHLDDEPPKLNWENGIVPVNNATVGNKSKTEDTLNSNGVLTDDAEEPSQYVQKTLANASSQTSSKFGSSADISNTAKKTQSSSELNVAVSTANKTNFNSISSSTSSVASSTGKVNGFTTSSSNQNQKGASSSSTFCGFGSSSEHVPKGVPPVCPVNAITLSSSGQRLSYAQVAQHNKEKAAEAEKQSAAITSSTMTTTTTTTTSTSTSTSTTVNSHQNVSNSATTNSQLSPSTSKSCGTNTNNSTNVPSVNDSDKKESSVNGPSSKQGGGGGNNSNSSSSGGSGNVGQKERSGRNSRQNLSTNERDREKDHKTSKRERRGEQSSKFSQTS